MNLKVNKDTVKNKPRFGSSKVKIVKEVDPKILLDKLIKKYGNNNPDIALNDVPSWMI